MEDAGTAAGGGGTTIGGGRLFDAALAKLADDRGSDAQAAAPRDRQSEDRAHEEQQR